MGRIISKIFAWTLAVIVIVAGNYGTTNLNADTLSVLTSEQLMVEGFQIKMVQSDDGVAFRAVCMAPNIGRSIVIDGKKYTILNLGAIYSKDPNTSGNNQNNILDKSYTELNPIPYNKQGREFDFKYIGDRHHNGVYLTFGYIASEKGILKRENGVTTYVMTMRNMEEFMTNTIRVRAFAEVVGEDGKELIVYGQYASLMSVAEIAYKIYAGSKAPNEEAHKYIYGNILNKIENTNPYYRDTEEEFGWGGSVEL